MGPFQISQRIGTHAYRLDLPPTMRVHPVFHVHLLDKYTRLHDTTHEDTALPVVTSQDGPDPIVESIQEVRDDGPQRKHRIRWIGLPSHQDTWVSVAVLLARPSTGTLLEDYHSRHPELAPPMATVRRQDVVDLEGG